MGIAALPTKESSQNIVATANCGISGNGNWLHNNPVFQ
jgi:hypothetical protein